MPKIDPSQLLDCLDSLLGSDGGIKGETEVKRLAVLMTKFSKKLVSKCIYILILKSTEPDLLARFMAEGGWALIFQWLDEGICNNNHALICEILELLLKCPISLDRLKENNCPKVVKGLSKDSESEEVKKLSGKLVEQWLKFIKSGQAAISDVAMAAASTANVSKPSITVLPSNITVISAVALNSGSGKEIKKETVVARKVSKPGIHIVREVSSSDEDEVPPIGSLPLYKITVRDGKSVLAKVGTKTLTLPPKKPEGEVFETSNSVSSVVLKSDAVSKKFRYVNRSVCDEERSNASDFLTNEVTLREKSDEHESVTVANSELILKQKRIDEAESHKDKTVENKVKCPGTKLENNRTKDGHKGPKTSKDLESSKHDSRYKDKDRKSGRESEKEKKKSDHKSHKVDKVRDRDKEKDREKESKNKTKDSSRDKHKDSDKSRSKDRQRKDEKDVKSGDKSLSAAEKAQMQADKDKDTLEKLKTPAITLLGKIPKKNSSQSGLSSTKASADSAGNKSSEPVDSKEKNASASADAKKTSDVRPSKTRPKTVKTFNSKFRSTGLEEEIKPPPPRGIVKKKADDKKSGVRSESISKKSSSPPKEGQPPEKRAKLAEVSVDLKKDKILEKPGGIKLIPPKPKPALLESDMFSDALTASTKLEPRKRKRRTSSSKDGSSDVKKEAKEEGGSTSTDTAVSPKDVKPSLKFYRDTMEEDEDKNKENSNEVKSEPKTEPNGEDSSKESAEDVEETEKPVAKLYPNGVLVCKTRKGPKKSVKWKEDSELTSVRLFELDETERVNVTRTFVDMKLMERSHEREAFQLARKLGKTKGLGALGPVGPTGLIKRGKRKIKGSPIAATDDTMEERIPWGPLYEVDIPPDRRSTVEPGKSSLEKNVQYAREKTVLQAIYFHRSLIPDSPLEPDPEVHPTTDPKIIPLEDITGNADSVSNFQNVPWPEPKPALGPQSPPQGHHAPGQHQPHLHGHQVFGPGYSSVVAFSGFPQMPTMQGMMPPGQANWRSGGDGKDMNMNMGFQPNGPMCPQMGGQPPNMFNAPGPEGFPMNGPSMPGFNPGFPMGCDAGMFGPPMGGMGMGGPPPGQWGRGGGGGGGWQGGRPFMGPNMNMQPKFQKGVCHHFAKFGNCARGSSCRFMHPN